MLFSLDNLQDKKAVDQNTKKNTNQHPHHDQTMGKKTDELFFYHKFIFFRFFIKQNLHFLFDFFPASH